MDPSRWAASTSPRTISQRSAARRYEHVPAPGRYVPACVVLSSRSATIHLGSLLATLMTRWCALACSLPVLPAGSLAQASVCHALIGPSTAPAQTAGPASLGAPAPYDLALSGTGPGHAMTDTPAPTNVAITY